MSSNHILTFLITSNVTGFKRIKNLRIRNLIEGVVYAAFTYYLISLIPFVAKVQMIVSICLCAAVFFGSNIGYKNQSPSELVMNMLIEKMYTHEYHMRSINDEKGKEVFFSNTGNNQSIADRFLYKIKNYKYEKNKL